MLFSNKEQENTENQHSSTSTINWGLSVDLGCSLTLPYKPFVIDRVDVSFLSVYTHENGGGSMLFWSLSPLLSL